MALCRHPRPRRGLGERTLPSPESSHRSEFIPFFLMSVLTS